MSPEILSVANTQRNKFAMMRGNQGNKRVLV